MTKNTRQDIKAAVALAALFLAVLFLGIGCTDSPAAPTPTAVAFDAPASVALDVPVGSPMMVADGGGVHMMVQPTLTLTVTPDGERDRVRASVGGIVGVSFYPGPNEKMPPNPLNGHGGQSITVRCDRTVSWSGGRPRVRTLPAGQRRRGDGVDVRVWVEHDGRRITHAGNAWASDGGSDYQVCAP